MYCILEGLYETQIAEREKAESDKAANASEMRDTLMQQMEQHREQHQRQLVELRREIGEKQARIEQLSE